MEKLNYKLLANPWFVLTEDFHFAFTLRTLYRELGGMDEMVRASGVNPDKQVFVTAPRGFVTDLASIPKPLQRALHPDGPWAAAACVHDLFYQKCASTGTYPVGDAGDLSRVAGKSFADIMFLRIMEVLGVDSFLRWTFYEAVREFGWPSYVDDNAKVVYEKPVEKTLTYNRNYLFIRECVDEAIPDHERVDITNGKSVNVKYLNVKRPFLTLE